MKTFFTALLLFFAQAASATLTDSSAYRALVTEGRAQFCSLFDRNAGAIAEGRPEAMQFVVQLSGNEGAVNYAAEENRGEKYGQSLSAASVKDTLNARLARIYAQYGVELYVILVNSLDVIVNAPLPENFTARDLFVRKLYDDSTNLRELRLLHASITQSILAYSLSGHDRDCIVFSQAQYCGTFFANEKKGCWSFTKISHHEASPRSYPAIAELKDYFTQRVQSNHLALSGPFDNQLYETVEEFGEAANYFGVKTLLMQTYTPAEMNVIFNRFDEELDYEGLNVTERLHVIEVYSGYPMHGDWLTNFEGEEGTVLRVLSFTPASQVAALLNGLAQPSTINNHPAYQGSQDGDALIKRLIDRTDDAAFASDNNYTKLVQVFTRMMTLSETVFADHLPQDDAGWHNRDILWKDYQALPPIGTQDYEIALNPNGTVTVTRKIVSSWIRGHYNVQTEQYSYTASWSTDATFDLQPFDLVYFTNKSSIGMLQVAGAANGQVLVAPAIFLEYAEDKTFNQTTLSAVATTLDAIALVTGPGAILRALDAGRLALAAFEALQFLGSAGNLAVNAIGDPDLQSVVDKYNLIVAAWGLSRVAATAGHYTADFFTEASQGGLNRLSPSQAQDFVQSYEQAGAKLTQLDAGTKTQAEKMYGYLKGKVGAVENAFGDYSTAIDHQVTVVAKVDLPSNLVETFNDGVYRTVQTTQEVTLYRNFGGSAKVNGSYATTITTATRDELALIPDFNNTMRFRSTIKVPPGQAFSLGKVGPWPPSNPILPGGADQIILPQFYNEAWIYEVVDLQTGQVYTLEQFKTAFPNQ